MYKIINEKISQWLEGQNKDFLVIAIDGPSAGGKTTIAEDIKKNFDCNVFHMDDFFLTPDRKTPERLATPGGNVDWEGVEESILKKLPLKADFSYDIYSCKTGISTSSEKIGYKKLNILEGCYSMHPELAKYIDKAIFVDVSREKQLERILKRSNEFMLNRFKTQWIPLEDLHFKENRCRERADFILDTTAKF